MKRNKMNRVPVDKSQVIVFTVFFILLVFNSLLLLYPVFWIFQNSFKTSAEYYANPNALPTKWNFSYYIEVFKAFKVTKLGGEAGFLEMVWNSVWLTFGGQLLNIAASVCVAYPLARYKFPLHKFFFGIIIFRITIPVIGASAASYKLLHTLNIIDNPLPFVSTFFNGFDINALIVYGYFKSIDKGYSEAAFIDGASCWTVLWKIIIPISLPCIFALYVNAVMGYWNVYSTSQISLPSYPNLAEGIYDFRYLMEKKTEYGDKMYFYFGAIIVSALVPTALFALSQNVMLKNMSVGGRKG